MLWEKQDGAELVETLESLAKILLFGDIRASPPASLADWFRDSTERKLYTEPRIERYSWLLATIPHEVTPENAWMLREIGRYLEGDYEPPKICGEEWFHNAPPSVRQTFPHTSVEQKPMMAFTPTDEMGREDKQIRAKVGRWVSRCVQPALPLDHSEVERIGRELRAEYALPELKWATTADDIQKVYEDGPHSCMAKPPEDWPDNFHPVRLYGQDLGASTAVAYMTRDGKVTARAVCNPKYKEYARIYGDTTLQTLLNKEGYEVGGLTDCRLPLVTTSADHTICPYIDGNEQYVSVCSDHLRVTSTGGVSADSQDGTLEGELEECGECGERVNEDNMRSVGEPPYEGYVCVSCLEHSYMEAIGEHGNHVFIPQNTGFEAGDGELFTSELAAERSNYEECGCGCGDHYHGADMEDTDDDGKVFEDHIWGEIQIMGSPVITYIYAHEPDWDDWEEYEVTERSDGAYEAIETKEETA